MKMCDLPRRTFTEKGYDLEFRGLSFFWKKPFFWNFHKKNIQQSISRPTDKAEKSLI